MVDVEPNKTRVAQKVRNNDHLGDLCTGPHRKKGKGRREFVLFHSSGYDSTGLGCLQRTGTF